MKKPSVVRGEPPPGKPTPEEIADENAALRAVKALGGRITVDAEQPGLPVVGVDFGKTEVTDADLKLLQAFKRLQSLNLSETKVTVPGLAELKGLKHLNTLGLDFREATGLNADAVMKVLGEMGFMFRGCLGFGYAEGLQLGCDAVFIKQTSLRRKAGQSGNS